MSRNLSILFIPLDAIGHINAAVGIAQVLIDSGHRVIFAINTQWNGRLVKYGIEEVLFTDEDRPSHIDPVTFWAHRSANLGYLSALSPLEKAIIHKRDSLPAQTKKMIKMDPIFEQIIHNIRPNVIIIDQFLCVPSVQRSGIPWFLTCSCNPLVLMEDERTPPAGSGLPTNGSELVWIEFRRVLNDLSFQTWNAFNEYIVAKGVKSLRKYKLFNESNYLNIYCFPRELDYNELKPIPDNYYRFDYFMRRDNQIKFEVPEQLRGKPGKLIYFSLGSMGAADVENMKRLIGILGKSKHRFIVSKGPLHSEYSLADNMWGQQSVPQIQVLPLVSLVITHGGNNTVTETFYFGKPLIVLPLMADQYDNAQRLHEKGFGLRLNPHNSTESELLDGIEKLLNDKELNEKLLKILERIQTENSIGKLPKLIEKLVVNN